MLMLVCLSLVASALAQWPVPAVSGQTHCMAQCMLLPPAQKRGCIEMCGAEAGAGIPSWINRPLETNWLNFEDKFDTTWFPTGAVIDQVPTGRDFEASRACFNKCYERGNNAFYCAKQCHHLVYE